MGLAIHVGHSGGLSQDPLAAGYLCGLPAVWMTLSGGPWVSFADIPTLSAAVRKLWSSAMPSSCERTLSDSSLDTSSWSFLVHSSVESHGQLTSFSTITEKKSFGNLIGLLKCFRSFLSLLSDTAQQGSKQPCFHCLSGSPQRWITAGASRSASTGTGS